MITFQPNCTFPHAAPAFVREPNIRSTMGIIWSSLAIIFLCTWSILHLTVPPQVLPPPSKAGRWRRIRHAVLRSLYGFIRKGRWMAITMISPELVLGWALSNYISARKNTQKIVAYQKSHAGSSEDGGEEEADWTMAHSMYAEIGGFFVRFPRRQEPERKPGPPATGSGSGTWRRWLDEFVEDNERGHPFLGPYDWKVHPEHYSLAKDLLESEVLDDPDSRRNCRALIGDVWVLSAGQILLAREFGIIGKLPTITESEIRDKSKEDALVKVLALVQAVWLAVELIIRASTGRQSSQIEIMALAFAVCALLSYLLLLSQPKDVSIPTVLPAVRGPKSTEFEAIVRRRVVTGPWPRRGYAMPNFATSLQDGGWVLLLGTVGGLLVFGSVHLIAWNFEFPTATEGLLWKISALVVALLPTAWLMSVFCLAVCWPTDDGDWGKRDDVIFWVFVILFSFPRLFLLVEAVRSTYYLPPSSYTSSWANNIPRVG